MMTKLKRAASVNVAEAGTTFMGSAMRTATNPDETSAAKWRGTLLNQKWEINCQRSISGLRSGELSAACAKTAELNLGSHSNSNKEYPFLNNSLIHDSF